MMSASWKCLLILQWLCLSINAYIDITVTSVGYSYAVELAVGSMTYQSIIDTGSYQLVTRNISYVLESNTSVYDFCLALTVDGTSAGYVAVQDATCPTQRNLTSIGSAQAVVTAQYSDYLQLDNPFLHDWTNTSAGDLGMAYNCGSSSCSLTAFQTILANSTDSYGLNQTFGLDFRDPNSTIATLNSSISSMQLGGVKDSYFSYINWFQQPQTNPTYHQLFIDSLQFCGAPILGNYSSNWEVLVDTGASCLTLPGEVYDHFTSWFDNNTVVNSWDDLPAFSFSVFGTTEELLLPLGALVLDTDAILTETGAPYINSLQQGEARLCVLKGANIENSLGDYTSPTPTIVFGSMALRPFYFAASFANVSVGLANKLSDSETAYYSNQSNPSCLAAVSCIGQQGYHPSSNDCTSPRCSRYFFQSVDTDSFTCQYDSSALIFGVVFISLIAFMEVASYLLNQYSASVLLQTRLPAPAAVQVDALTACLGKYMSAVADQMITKVLKWNNGAGAGARGVMDDAQNELLHRA